MKKIPMSKILILLIVYISFPSKVRAGTNECFPIARTFRSEQNVYLPENVICNGDLIGNLLRQGQPFICFLDNIGIRFWNSQSGCSLSTDQRTRLSNKSNMIRPFPKGTLNNFQSQIIRPFGSILLHNPKFISWQAVQGATKYSVQVKGVDFVWERSTTEPELSYPKNTPSMTHGNTYKITIFYYRSQESIQELSKLYVIPSKQIVDSINYKINIIKTYALSDDERVYDDLGSFCLSNGLNEEYVSLLDSRIKAGSLNPNIYRALSKQYSDQGFISIANDILKKSKNLNSSSYNNKNNL